MNTYEHSSSYPGLPDLTFVELKAWWGPVNTSSVGLFVRYGVINNGFELNQSTSISSNLSFFADGNETSFGYIIQTPLLYPTHWYPGEILSGCYYFEVEKKPSTISAFIDYNQSIEEINEENNVNSVLVIEGIKLNGRIYYGKEDNYRIYNGTVEISRCENESLSSYLFRHFKSDDEGKYALSFYPENENISQKYYILTTKIVDNQKIVKKTPKMKSGETYVLDFYFIGNSPSTPSSPLGRITGQTNQIYLIFSYTTDVDNHSLFYKFYWGNGHFSDWLGPYKNSKKIATMYNWNYPGIYDISVIAKDETGLISEWSESKRIKIHERLFPPNPFLHDLREVSLNFFIRTFLNE
jgi:hypothetical protein